MSVNSSTNKSKVAYFEGRPHGHPTHSEYAKSVGAKFYHFDKYLRYHDNPKASKFKRYLSWLLTALCFPKNKYNVFLTQEPYYAIILMRMMGLISPNQKIISMFGTHTLYFMKENRYSAFTKKMLLYLFSKYDTIICEGEMQKDMLLHFLKDYKKKPDIYSIPNGSNSDRLKTLIKNIPNLSSNRIVTVASGDNESRLYYKGLDLNVNAFNQLVNAGGDYYYDIIGQIPENLQDSLLKQASTDTRSRVTFLGQISNFEEQISSYSLCIHISRGEAWGISINDCMAAGIPVLVSEWTGSKQIVAEVSTDLITSFKIDDIVFSIQKYLALPLHTKQLMSEKCRKVSLKYSEEYAINQFQKYFNKAQRVK